jgi:diguanylate cyclase (GGDEF)-like protein
MMLALRFLLSLLFLCVLAPMHCDAAGDRFADDLAAVRDEVQVMPRAALQKLDIFKDGLDGTDLGRVLVQMSLAHARLGDKDKALEEALLAEQLANADHDNALLAEATLARANVYANLVHDPDTARQLVLQAAQLANMAQDAGVQIQVAAARALQAEEDGRDTEGLQIATQAVEAARLGNDPHLLALALHVQARLLAGEDRYDEALASSAEVNAIARASKQPAQIAQARLAEYAIAAHAGQVKRAENALQAAIDMLDKLDAKESLVPPLVNMAELYTQQLRYGEAARASQRALKIAEELNDKRGIRLASFQLGIADIHFRDIANGRKMVEAALAGLQDDDRYLPMLLEYGYALGKVGEGDAALNIYRKASAVSRADWRKERQLSYLALQRAYETERKKSEVAALRHETALKAAELETERRLKTSWVLLSVTTLFGVIVIAILYRRVASTNRLLHQKNEQLFQQSTRDSLTGLFNRHYFYEHVVPDLRELPGAPGPDRRARPGGPAGGVFLLLDVDRFKSINDTYGHGAGDVVLKTVAARLSGTLREEDVLIRWGGEEFLAYLPGIATDEARRVCARVLAAVSSQAIPIDGHDLTVTISIGFCPHPASSDEMGWEQLVHLADLCLYLAKTAGRNQAFGIDDASALTPSVFAAAESDLKQASTDGLVELVNIKTPAAPATRPA